MEGEFMRIKKPTVAKQDSVTKRVLVVKKPELLKDIFMFLTVHLMLMEE